MPYGPFKTVFSGCVSALVAVPMLVPVPPAPPVPANRWVTPVARFKTSTRLVPPP